jgi:putative hemolysin
LVLDASKDKHHPNELIIWENNQGSNQKWQFTRNNDNSFSIRNVESGGTLEIPDHSKAQLGCRLCVSAPNGTINERWRINSQGGGYIIESAFNGMVLDVCQEKYKNGTSVILYTNKQSMNQTWAIRPA